MLRLHLNGLRNNAFILFVEYFYKFWNSKYTIIKYVWKTWWWCYGQQVLFFLISYISSCTERILNLLITDWNKWVFNSYVNLYYSWLTFRMEKIRANKISQLLTKSNRLKSFFVSLLGHTEMMRLMKPYAKHRQMLIYILNYSAKFVTTNATMFMLTHQTVE